MKTPMDVATIAHVLRERIMCHDKNITSVKVMTDCTLAELANEWNTIQTQNANVDEQPDEVVYYIKSADKGTTEFKLAVYFTLLGCIGNLPICVMLEGETMGTGSLTLRRMMRTICRDCSKLTPAQFVSILERLANQLVTPVP